MRDAPDISVVVPVYGCRDCLEALVDSVRSAFADTDLGWECILVDDCGPDEPWPTITELSWKDGRVRESGLHVIMGSTSQSGQASQRRAAHGLP